MPTTSVSAASNCLSRQHGIVSRLRDLTPIELGVAATTIRQFFIREGFSEVVLAPFDKHPIDYLDEVVDVNGIGQLRFNTEPEIWNASRYTDSYFSISTLFRRETLVNSLRRNAFLIVDFYQHGAPDKLITLFRGLLSDLGKNGVSPRLNQLPFDEARYDRSIDGPHVGVVSEPQWVIATGYEPDRSFFEVDDEGISTRRELFLVTPMGHLEVGVVGITGWNRNRNYRFRSETAISPDVARSGMCFGLERLLLSEQVLMLLSG